MSEPLPSAGGIRCGVQFEPESSLVVHSQQQFLSPKIHIMHSEAALFALGWAAMIWIATGHDGHEHSQKVVAGPHKSLWYNRLPGDGGKQVCTLSSPRVPDFALSLVTNMPIRPTPSFRASLPLAVCRTSPVLRTPMPSTTLLSSVPHSTPEHRTAQVLGSAPRVSDKALVG